MSAGETYDYSDRRTTLMIRSDKVMEEPGLLLLPGGRWSTFAGVPALDQNVEGS